MEKMDVMVFASICIISAFYIYFFDKKNKFKKKIIGKEIDEVITNLSHGNTSKKKRLGEK